MAIWDGEAEAICLVTDWFRIHPLAYYSDPEKLVFGSRIAAIRACPYPIRLTINPEAIVDVVGASVIPTPKTIFREIKKLPPRSILTYRRGNVTVEPYGEISFLNPSRQSTAELTDQTKNLFREAIRMRVGGDHVSDRVGTFLSGGVDSSTVTGVLTQLAGRSIKTFSIGFDEQRFNEINYARIAAQAFGAEHHEYFVSPSDAYDAIPILLSAFDEPYANASAIPTYFCAKLAREHGVDTLFAGDGGDELFAGNERYATQRLFDYYHQIPAWVREPLLKPLVFALAEVGLGVFVKGKKYIQRASIPYPQRLTSYGLFKTIPMGDLFDEEFLKSVAEGYDPSSLVHAAYTEARAETELDRQLAVDLRLAITENDLLKVTRMTEAAGVAVHFPFLDHRLAEFAATIPAHIKMRGRRLRSFFKRAYADLLPIEIRTKTKHGFGLPIPIWLRTDPRLNEMMRDLVLSPRSLQRGYFEPRALEDLVRTHQTDETSFYGTALWNLMALELWHRHHGL
jgi:asparagine synthase (glutamine-hydrolysing)